MKKIISAQIAKQILLSILGLLIVFHLLVIVGIIPANLVWGNQIDQASILPIELISIVVTVSFGLFVLIKMRYLSEGRKSIFITLGLWVIALFLMYNTVTNILSEVNLENYVFAPLAFILSLLTARLAIEK